MPVMHALRLPALLRSLRQDTRAVVLIEFAYSLPILMLLAFTAIEATNLAIANMRVSQITMTVADNLSRAMQSVPVQNPELREVDINDAILGAKIQGGGSVPILTKGRVVISNLHRRTDGNQEILWQRCKGELQGAESKYGIQGDRQGVKAGFTGMGTGTVIQAPAGSDIIFAEITYQYQPLVGKWALGDFTIRREAAFLVRDSRRQIAPINPAPNANQSLCGAGTYNSTF